jgi:hypothetical protein
MILTKEIGDYIIHSDGKIWSNKRKKYMIPQSVATNRFGNKILTVGIRINNKRKFYGIHRLVAECFIENPENKRTVNHIDGNTENNYVSNLEWATDSENQKHSYRVLGRKISGCAEYASQGKYLGKNNPMYGKVRK